MAQQVKNVAGKFGGKGISALLGLAGLGYATTQSFYSGKFVLSNLSKKNIIALNLINNERFFPLTYLCKNKQNTYS